MSELEERISSILNSPEEMSRLAQMAQSLLGGDAPADDKSGGEATSGMNSGLMRSLAGLFGGDAPSLPQGETKSDKLALIEAMSPFLGEKRRKKMSRALQIAKAARFAGVFLAENGGEGDL